MRIKGFEKVLIIHTMTIVMCFLKYQDNVCVCVRVRVCVCVCVCVCSTLEAQHSLETLHTVTLETLLGNVTIGRTVRGGPEGEEGPLWKGEKGGRR